MKKASMLLSIFALLCLLVAAPAAYADQEPPVIDPPSETDVPPLAEDGETEPEDIPADLPGGTVYAVSGAALPGQEADAAGQALTVVDYQLASGGESGAVYAGQSIYYYGADIAGVTYGVQIDGAGCGYFGSSDGAIPLYDGKGAVAGIVWGDRRQSTIDCDVGFLVQGDVTGGFTVEDGTAVNAKQELILCQSGSGSFRFNNARLHTDSGVLVRMAPDAGALTLSYKNGAYAGAHINESASPLTVRVEQGTLLYGDTSAEGGPVCVTVEAGGIWAVQQSASLTQLTVEEGGTVYGALEQNEDGSLTLLSSDSVLEPGVYESQPAAEDLPFGPGPAVAEQGAAEPAQEIEAESEQEPATETDAYPEPEATPEPEEEVESAPEQEPATEADAYPEPEPTPEPKPENESEAEPETEPADDPEPAVEPGSEPAESADPLHLRAELEHSVLYSFGLSRQSILDGLGSARHSASSIGLTAQLAARAGRGPVVAELIKTGAKTHSFLPETLDKPSRILYNPYCCLAA